MSYVSYISFQLQWSGQLHPTWHKLIDWLIDFSHNRKVKHHVYVKRQTRIFTTWPSFPFTYRLLFIISTHKLAASRNFLCKRIVLSCFYLLIFYIEKFSTWIWLLTFAIYVKLKFSPNNAREKVIKNQNDHVREMLWFFIKFSPLILKEKYGDQSQELYADSRVHACTFSYMSYFICGWYYRWKLPQTFGGAGRLDTFWEPSESREMRKVNDYLRIEISPER